jgi:hypothetical protein
MIRETDRRRRVATTWGRTVLDYPERPADTHPETLAWIARIEQMRLEEADPHCSTCGSTVPVTQTRRCFVCGETKPITAFVRNRSKLLGRGHRCRPCHIASCDESRINRKRRQIREILGVAS